MDERLEIRNERSFESVLLGYNCIIVDVDKLLNLG